MDAEDMKKLFTEFVNSIFMKMGKMTAMMGDVDGRLAIAKKNNANMERENENLVTNMEATAKLAMEKAGRKYLHQ